MRAAQKNDVIKFLDDWAGLTDRQKQDYCERSYGGDGSPGEYDAMRRTLNTLVNSPHRFNKALQIYLDSESALESAKVDRACGVKV